MDKICAAHVMEWSIELENGLQSKKPGKVIESILQTGTRLEQWSKEPNYPLSVLQMFGLIPGEDRLFANTILLRLADAFKSGDKQIRICVLKVFFARDEVQEKWESRGLVLRFIGCWADFANDSAEIRYMVSSSLGSCHVLEVKASLFVVGCFSELSEDFACIVLESLQGKKLVLEFFHEEFIAEMLVALSKLASKSVLLISEQVDLLLPFLVQPSASCVQAIALRCFKFLLAGGVCHFPVNASLLKAFSYIVDSSSHSLSLQCEALKLLRKIIGMEMTSDANGLINLPSWVLLSLLDQIEGLVKPVLETCRTTSEVEQECRSLLYLIVSLVKEHPSLGVLVLDKIRLIIEPMMVFCTENSETTVVSSSLRDTVMFDVGRHVRVASNLISGIYKVVESCVITLDIASAITSQLHQSMKLLLNVILQSSLFTQDIHIVHLFFLHFHVMGVNDDNGICIAAEELRIANINYRFQHERLVVEYMKKMMAGNDNWSAYKFVQWAACQGMWLVVAILSGQLTNKVQSESNVNWLKSLTLFAQAESTAFCLISQNKIMLEALQKLALAYALQVKYWDVLSHSMKPFISKAKRQSHMKVVLKLRNFHQTFVGFVLYHPNLYDKSMLRDLENLMKCSHSTLLKDAIKRLQHVDEETSTNMKVLLTSIEEPKSCFHLHQKAFLYRSGFREREILVVSRNAVVKVLHLQGEASKMNCKGILGQMSKAGVQLLKGILIKWMQISLQVPKYFFQVRPCPGAELFTCSADNRKADKISILPGSHLSLNFCLQMKNVPEVLSASFYCVLACKPSYCTPASDGQMKEQRRSGYRASESDDSLDLNEKLMLYVMNCTDEMGTRKCGDGCGFMFCFVSFDELNQRGQGFSNCLFDVTAFPEGSYVIKWHSCFDSQGSYWSLLPLSAGPRFSVKKPPVAGD
ncbi:hypothetical protein MKX01_032317 [Papaver californicum]|nr:hypothetical protein MKX01_032317 [Papaver californicum]